MKEVFYGGIKFNIDPDDYYNADYVQAYPNTISSYISGSLMTIAGSVSSSIVWTPKIAEYLGVSDVPETQGYIAGVVFIGLQSMLLGTSIQTAENMYDSYRFIYDYNVAAIGEAYDSYIDAPDAS